MQRRRIGSYSWKREFKPFLGKGIKELYPFKLKVFILSDPLSILVGNRPIGGLGGR